MLKEEDKMYRQISLSDTLEVNVKQSLYRPEQDLRF